MTMGNRLSRAAQDEMEKVWQLRRESVILLGHVVAEWKSDPKSVQCFDLRLVKRAEEVLAELKKLDIFNEA